MTIRMALAAACALSIVQIAQADEIKVLGSGAMQEIAHDLLPEFEKSSGHKITATWTGTVKIKERIEAGEVFDLVIVGAPEIDKFIAERKLAAGSRVDLAKSGVGVAVKAGAPKPDISSGEAVKKAMLAAKALPIRRVRAASTSHGLIQKFGIAEEMKPKSKRTAPGLRVGQYLARGEADARIPAGERALARKRRRLRWPTSCRRAELHELLKRDIAPKRKSPTAAKALQAFLSAPTAAAVIQKERHGAGPLGWRPVLRRHLERCKLKSRRDRAAHQCPRAEAFGSLPVAGRHDTLRPLAHRDVRADLHAADRAAGSRHLQHQRRTRVVVPDLGRIDAMPVRSLALRQQEIDRGGSGAAVRIGARVAKRLAEMPAFRMRLQIEQADHVGGGKLAHGVLSKRSSKHAQIVRAARPA